MKDVHWKTLVILRANRLDDECSRIFSLLNEDPYKNERMLFSRAKSDFIISYLILSIVYITRFLNDNYLYTHIGSFLYFRLH